MSDLLNRHLGNARSILRDQELIAQALPGGPLGGALELPGRPAGPMRVGAGYQNMYGTDINASYDLNSGQLEGSATIPIGRAERGLQFQGRVGYGPQGPSAFMGVRRQNLPSDPREAARVMGLNDPYNTKYSYGIGLNDGLGGPSGGGMPMPPGGGMAMPPGGGFAPGPGFEEDGGPYFPAGYRR